jgi:hypothetical protein
MGFATQDVRVATGAKDNSGSLTLQSSHVRTAPLGNQPTGNTGNTFLVKPFRYVDPQNYMGMRVDADGQALLYHVGAGATQAVQSAEGLPAEAALIANVGRDERAFALQVRSRGLARSVFVRNRSVPRRRRSKIFWRLPGRRSSQESGREPVGVWRPYPGQPVCQKDSRAEERVSRREGAN